MITQEEFEAIQPLQTVVVELQVDERIDDFLECGVGNSSGFCLRLRKEDIIEVKPFPANRWYRHVHESEDPRSPFVDFEKEYRRDNLRCIKPFCRWVTLD